MPAHHLPTHGVIVGMTLPRRFDTARNWALVESLARDSAAGVIWIFCADRLRTLLLTYAQAHGRGCRDGGPIWWWLAKEWDKSDSASADDDTLLDSLADLDAPDVSAPAETQRTAVAVSSR